MVGGEHTEAAREVTSQKCLHHLQLLLLLLLLLQTPWMLLLLLLLLLAARMLPVVGEYSLLGLVAGEAIQLQNPEGLLPQRLSVLLTPCGRARQLW